MSLLRCLVEDALGGMPDKLEAIWPEELADTLALAFKAGPILPMMGTGSPRAFVSNQSQRTFVDQVAMEFGESARPFLSQLGPDTRKIVDTDGHSADLFLDDLQDVDHDLAVPDGLTLMCSTLHLPSGRRTWLTRHGPPPRELLDQAWTARLDALLDHGLRGLWGIRWGADGIYSLLCVNEDRWSGTPEPASLILDGLADPRWLAARARARAAGLGAYPDAIEVHADRWDVTVGLFDPTQPSRRR